MGSKILKLLYLATTTFQLKITFEVGDGFFGAAPFDGQGDAVFPGNFDNSLFLVGQF